MTIATLPNLFVVDGSNIATEGRSVPSLEQLNEAVLAFLEANPDTKITVVVDATFGHRIDKSETAIFDEAVANNELVTPPAGAIGRGDAFVLSIAHKAGAGVLSNDSFQEFHGEYDWLFDEGRLIGGKPVPHVGWVFVARAPVRGPKSRQAVKSAKVSRKGRSGTKASKGADPREAKNEANKRIRRRAADADTGTAAEGEHSASVEQKKNSGRGRRSSRGSGSSPNESTEHVNDLMAFLEFVENHPVGARCVATVESYSSHGAYARAGEVLVYVPLRLMGSPTPRSARSVLDIGQELELVVEGYVPDRRSVDGAVPGMETTAEAREAAAAESEVVVHDESADTPPERMRVHQLSKQIGIPNKDILAAAERLGIAATSHASSISAAEAATLRSHLEDNRGTSATDPVHTDAALGPVDQTGSDPAPRAVSPSRRRRSGAARRAARAASADADVLEPDATGDAQPSAAQTPAKKNSPAKKTPVAKTSPAKKAPAKKAAAKKAAAKKTPAKKKGSAKKAAAKKTPAKKNVAAKKARAKKQATTDKAAQ